MSSRPAVLDTQGVNDLDLLTTRATEILGSALREGMVLMDPALVIPAVWLDHKVTCPARLGAVRFLAHDLDTNRLTEVTIHATRP